MYGPDFQAGPLFWWIVDKEKAIVKGLEQQGGIKQFVANEPRLSEAVAMYKEAGFEVHLEPLPPQSRHSAEEKCKLDGYCANVLRVLKISIK